LAREKRSGLLILEQEAMAMIAVQVVLEKLASFVPEKTRFLGGVRGGIVELQDDLYSMKSFLQDAEERSESDQGLRAWIKQVRDVAYDAEDILEDFMLRFAPSHGSGVGVGVSCTNLHTTGNYSCHILVYLLFM
jgi:hypothetical protein